MEIKVWKEAMREELRSIDNNQTCELVPQLEKKKIISVRRVYETKLNPNDSVSKHIARLMVKRFVHKHGINYNEVFAHVKRLGIIRLAMAITSNSVGLCTI